MNVRSTWSIWQNIPTTPCECSNNKTQVHTQDTKCHKHLDLSWAPELLPETQTQHPPWHHQPYTPSTNRGRMAPLTWAWQMPEMSGILHQPLCKCLYSHIEWKQLQNMHPAGCTPSQSHMWKLSSSSPASACGSNHQNDPHWKDDQIGSSSISPEHPCISRYQSEFTISVGQCQSSRHPSIGLLHPHQTPSEYY